MRSVVVFFLVLGISGCGETPPPIQPTATIPTTRAVARPLGYGADDATWGRYHSKRFNLSFPLPDGKAWRIDDHTRPALVAVHDATSSSVSVQLTHEDDLMNRKKCEERARDLGWVPSKTLTTVDDEVTVGPEAFDSRVWVAVDAARPGGALEGHVYLFGSFIRTCLFVHVSTKVPSANDEDVLSDRLALVRARLVRGVALDPPRTTEDATVPRAKPEIRR